MTTKQELENTLAAASKCIEVATKEIATATLAINQNKKIWMEVSEQLKRFMYLDEVLRDNLESEVVEGSLIVKSFRPDQMKRKVDLGKLSLSLRTRGLKNIVIEVAESGEMSTLEISWINYASPDNANPVWLHGEHVTLINIPPLIEWRIIKDK